MGASDTLASPRLRVTGGSSPRLSSATAPEPAPAAEIGARGGGSASGVSSRDRAAERGGAPTPIVSAGGEHASRAILRDGSAVSLRPAGTDDEGALLAFLHELCLDSRRMRFFTGAPDLRSAAHWAADVEPGGFGLIAADEEGRLVGHAAYAPLAGGRAEVAVEVADRTQGLGLGTILIERLAREAERRGIHTFLAEVLPENRQMLAVFKDGFDAEVVLEAGTEAVAFPTAAWRLAEHRFG